MHDNIKNNYAICTPILIFLRSSFIFIVFSDIITVPILVL